jgi:hypothetical protein
VSERASEPFNPARRLAGTIRSTTLTRRLLRCGVLAGPLFITTFLVEGATRADYSPVRHPVSSLALGPGGWVQTANFCVTGGLYAAFAAGLPGSPEASTRSRVGPIVIGAVAVGLIGSGVFLTDPISGYPPGTPAARPSYGSTAAALHDLSAVPVFLGIPAAGLIYSWRFHRAGHPLWSAYSAGSALAMLGGFGLASAAFAQTPSLVKYGGLFQRAAVGAGLGWLTALAVRTLRTLPSR